MAVVVAGNYQIIAVCNKELRIVLEELCRNHGIAAAVSCRISLRDGKSTAFDEVEYISFLRVHSLELDADIRLSVDFGVVDVQTFLCINRKAAVSVFLVLVA